MNEDGKRSQPRLGITGREREKKKKEKKRREFERREDGRTKTTLITFTELVQA